MVNFGSKVEKSVHKIWGQNGSISAYNTVVVVVGALTKTGVISVSGSVAETETAVVGISCSVAETENTKKSRVIGTDNMVDFIMA